MMKAIIYAAIGYWLSRQFYESYLKGQQQKNVEKAKFKLKEYLIEQGLSKTEINTAEQQIFNHYEY